MATRLGVVRIPTTDLGYARPGRDRGIMMEIDRFDTLTRHVGSQRRQALRVLGGVLLGVLIGPVGLRDASEAAHRKRRKRRKGTKSQQSDACAGAAAPACDACQEVHCDATIGQYFCARGCRTGQTCSRGRCMATCSNGCEVDAANGNQCTRPPAGTRYCAAGNQCVAANCPLGSTFSDEHCQCQCASDGRFVCPADNQCCAQDELCTVDGCCDQRWVCTVNGVDRCCV